MSNIIIPNEQLHPKLSCEALFCALSTRSRPWQQRHFKRAPALSTRNRVLKTSRKHRHLQTPSVSPAADVSPPISPPYGHIKSRIIYLLCNEMLFNRSRSPTCVHIVRLAKLTRTAYFLFQNKRTLLLLDGLGAINEANLKPYLLTYALLNVSFGLFFFLSQSKLEGTCSFPDIY